MNPTYEFIGPNGPYGKKTFQFLKDHQYCDYVVANCALYPPTFLLPNGQYFVMADQSAILWDPVSNSVKKTFSNIPKNHYTYPVKFLCILISSIMD